MVRGFWFFMAGVMAMTLFLQFGPNNGSGNGPLVEATIATAAQVNQNDEIGFLEVEKNTISVFKSAAPSVVFINSSVRRRNFFTLDETEIPSGSGSGFVWDGDGHVVTNFHVIENATSFSVTLHDQTIHQARVVGMDPSKDIAVLKINAPRESMQPIAVGSSATLQVGQMVLAIGNPFGLDHTLTTGVVSAIGREIKAGNGRTITDVIQTDASINPGNSGGPLLDSRGKLIGVNTMIYSPSGASVGIGFAVPANTVKRVVPQIITFGHVQRPGLGVSTIHDAIARRNGIEGIVIAEVPPGSAAAAAGLKGLRRGGNNEYLLGDIIVRVEDRRVNNTTELADALDRYEIGQEVTLTVLRESKEHKISIRLQALQ